MGGAVSSNKIVSV